MQTSELNIPSEIWYEILSFSSLPSAKRVSKKFSNIEKTLLHRRIYRLKKKFSYIDAAIREDDWDAVTLMLHYKRSFPIANVGNCHKMCVDKGRVEIAEKVMHMHDLQNEDHSIWRGKNGRSSE